MGCWGEVNRRALLQAGPVRLICAHMGGWRNWEEVPALLAETGVYLDTSFSLGTIPHNGDGHFSPEELSLLNEQAFMVMVRAFGAHRLLFGTDSPWGGQPQCLAQLRALPLTAEEQAAILGGNARWLLGI